MSTAEEITAAAERDGLSPDALRVLKAALESDEALQEAMKGICVCGEEGE